MMDPPAFWNSAQMSDERLTSMWLVILPILVLLMKLQRLPSKRSALVRSIGSESGRT
jgi:hypothetical protein